MQQKKCSQCGQIKDLSEFAKDRYKKSGARSECKQCGKPYSKEYRTKHRDKVIQATKKWKENNRQRCSVYTLKYQRDHKYRYAQNNKQKHINYLSKPENQKKYLARLAALFVKITPDDSCRDCGNKDRLERHHTDYNKPLEFIILCKTCHSKLHRKYIY